MSQFISLFKSTCFSSLVVQDHETALHFHEGRYLGILAPGKHRFFSNAHEVKRVDTREQAVLVQGQELLTADQVALRVSAIASYRVVDALKMHRTTADPVGSLYIEVQLALRQVIAAEPAETFLGQKSLCGQKLVELAAGSAAAMGLQLYRLDIRDVMLPAELKRSYMAALQQRQEAVATLEKARSETAALRTLANAAKLMRDNPEILQLRYLQTLQEVGAAPGNTLLLGLTDADKLKAAQAAA